MNRPVSILWIEEETNNAVANRRSYINWSNKFKIEIVETYHAGMKAIHEFSNYDVIIMDIRIPLGQNTEENLNMTVNAHHNRYGLDLIEKLYELQNSSFDRLMIFTNESWEDIVDEFEPLKLHARDRFLQKRECRSDSDFEKFILKTAQKLRSI